MRRKKIYYKLYSYLSDRIRRDLQTEAAFRIAKKFFADHKDPEVIRRLIESQRYRFGIRPTQHDMPEGLNLLVYAPHQDDETLGAGGTLIRSRLNGKRVQAVYVTDGAARTSEYNDASLADKRKEEALEVWRQIGGESPLFWDLPCRKIPLNPETAKKMREQIDAFKPDCIFVPFFLEPPPDHRATNQLLLMSHKIKPLDQSIDIWAYQVSSMMFPNVIVDITELNERKERINELWVSQNNGFNYAHYASGLGAYNSMLLEKKHSPNPQKKYAELFFVAKADEYLQLVSEYLV